MEIWPFMVGRTKTVDYRVITLPEFMTTESLTDLLRDAVDPPPDTGSQIYTHEFQSRVGDAFIILYTISALVAEDYGLPGTGQLTDEFGRPITVTEGFVTRGEAEHINRSGIARQALAIAHEVNALAYREFWAEGLSFERRRIGPFPLIEDEWSGVPDDRGLTEPTADPGHLDSAMRGARKTGVVTVALIAALCVLIALIWWLR